MKKVLKQAWARFRSEVPPIIKKIQVVLGLAAGTFTTAAAINWPGKLVVAGTVCGYLAAGCGASVLALQFIQQTATVFETKQENASL